jgi:hypothetical protein
MFWYAEIHPLQHREHLGINDIVKAAKDAMEACSPKARLDHSNPSRLVVVILLLALLVSWFKAPADHAASVSPIVVEALSCFPLPST